MAVVAASVAAAADLGKYIVVFEKGPATPENIVEVVKAKLVALGASIGYEYHTVLKGFALTIPKDVMVKFQKEDEASVQSKEFPFFIEEDKEVTTN
ncbi:hypothetical protein TRVA0_017S00760 [Trichomonascus vanleenenianus]|uniref:uncharacterized protein n=1 Tax=Trichomonascus vanleenenianus TaxID=2268995 RepID=UPI003ECABD7D